MVGSTVATLTFVTENSQIAFFNFNATDLLSVGAYFDMDSVLNHALTVC